MNQDKNYISELSRITEVILISDINSPETEKAVTDLHDLFKTITEMERFSEHPAVKDAFQLRSGKVISPWDSASAVLDVRTTAKFIRGLYEAILSAIKKFPGECINVFYAQCGPYAPFAFPLMTKFSPAEVRFSLADVFPFSMDAQKRLAGSFGFEEFINEYIICDAAEYKHHDRYPLHILITLSMQKALSSGPQVAVMANLVPQLKKEGLVLPEKIKVMVKTGDPNKLFKESSTSMNKSDSDIRTLGCLFELSKKQIKKINRSAMEGSILDQPLLPVKLYVPAQKNKNNSLLLFTELTIFKNIVLTSFESGITVPIVFTGTSIKNKPLFIITAYWAGADPRFKFRSSDGAYPLSKLLLNIKLIYFRIFSK